MYRHCCEFKGGFVNSGSLGDKAVRSLPPATLVLMTESGKGEGEKCCSPFCDCLKLFWHFNV